MTIFTVQCNYDDVTLAIFEESASERAAVVQTHSDPGTGETVEDMCD